MGYWNFLRSGDRFNENLEYINGGVGFRIAFADLNNAPINLRPITNLSIEENQPVGTIVGEFNSSDPDGNSISYFLVSGQGDDNNTIFTLEENGTLKTAIILDYESSISTLSIRVQVRDELNATTDGNFSVLLIDLDDQAPILSLVGASSINHEVGSLFYDLNATWVDNVDGNGTISGTGTVDTNVLGSYVLSYDYTDSSGNAASTVTRTVTVVDTTAPVLTIIGDENITHEAGQLYTDANASWSDHVDGSGLVTASGSVDVNTPGSYVLSYDYTDSNGNSAITITRTVTVVDTTAPVLTIIGDENITHEAGQLYTDANASWSDHVDGSGLVTASGSVDVNTPGSYVLSYDYTDSNGNSAITITRTVTVVDTTVPVLTIIGDENITHEAGQLYTDANASWSDHVDGSGLVTASGSVDVNTPGSYVLSYDYTDSNGNAAITITRTVIVVDTTAPVLTIIGDENITHEAGQLYTDANASWIDHVDGSGLVTASGSIDVNTPGSYTLSYDYTDSNGNSAITNTRTVTVVDTTAPVLTIIGDENITHEAGQLYTDANASWSDHVDGSGLVTASGSVDVNTPGSYVLSYDYTDSNGNSAITITRTVTVVDTTVPVLTIIGDENITHEAGQLYTDANASWSDHVDGSGLVTASGSVDVNTPGSYVLSYDYTDSNGNSAITITRTVTVVDTTVPVLTIIGDENITHEAGELYTDANASWSDHVDGSGLVTASGSVDVNTPGSYVLSYDYTDSYGNAAITITRTVTVVDTTAPVLTIIGDENITHEAGQLYTDANASWSDHVDGSGLVTASGNVNINILGSYVLSYNYTDSNGNAASTITRTVTVVDTTPPEITLNGPANLAHQAGLSYEDAHATWTDFIDGSGTINATGSVNINVTGTYLLSYDYTDSSGNTAETKSRTVTIFDSDNPVILLNGDQNITHSAGEDYYDQNATWVDAVDGSGLVTASGSVDSNTPGTYVLSYDYTDSNGNAAITITRTVTVVDTTAPVLIILGDENITHEAGFLYTDANATWIDHVDGNGTVTATGYIDTNTPGSYTLSYDYTDSNGNAAITITRTVTVVDTTAPVLTIIGDENITHEAGQLYTDANASWSDHVDGSGLVSASGSVDSNTPGTYVLSYDYTDSNGNAASTITRTVTVVDTTVPVLTIIGDENITHEAGELYTDANASWSDHVDGSGLVTASGSVDSNTPGTYVLSYDYTDSNGNAAITITRTVTVVDTTAPVLTIIGDENITHEAGQLYTDANASWSDHVDGSGLVTASGNVNINIRGSYVLSYNYTDSNGNAASTITRTVTVVDTTAPVLTIIGDENITHEAGQLYTDANASWSDHVDGSGLVSASGSVDSNTPGTYVLSYDYTDSNGNAASTITQTVTVVDTTAPVLTIIGDENITHEAGQLYTDANASWSDHVDGSGLVSASGNVNINILGSYVLSYNYTDSNGNAASTITRTVTVVDTTPPEITLNGPANLAHQAGLSYEDAHATWTDFIDGSGTINATGSVNINVTGTYLLSYDYTDSSGNTAETKSRTVTIFDSDNPVILLNGDQNITHSAGEDYYDQNATWMDAVDGSGLVSASGSVDSNTPGTYVLSYDYTDSNGNAASTITRTVTVVDTTAPVLTIIGDENITHEAGFLYTDANATWIDHVDGNGTVTATGYIDTNTPGAYTLSYNFIDSAGNAATKVTRSVIVVDTTAPVITLNGASSITQEVGVAYIDTHATWSDFVDGNGTISATGSVNFNVPGTYQLTYNYTDSSGNAANTVVRQVIIEENSENDDTESINFQDDLSDSTPVQGSQGWWESSWMGAFYAESYPWIYHQNLGWLFVHFDSPLGTWMYHERLGWLWTMPDVFPHLFLPKRNQWFHVNQSTSKTTIYDYQEQEWFEPDTPIRIFSEEESHFGGEVTGYGYYYRWDPVILEARANANYNFAGWSGDINSMEQHIEFEALRDLKIDASFLAIPSANLSANETLENINDVLNKMEHLSDAEKKRSIAELLIFGTSPTSGLSIKK